MGGKSIPFELTYVRYQEGDVLGYLLAITTLAPIYIAAAYCTLLVTQRNVDIVLILLGQTINLVLNKVLKKVIAQPRPEGCDLKDWGMPSNHSQFVAYACATFSLLLARHMIKSRLLVRRPIFRVLFISAAIVLCLCVCTSRVYLKYHTIEQVVVGALVGACAGWVWTHVMSNKFIRRQTAKLLDLIFDEGLYINEEQVEDNDKEDNPIDKKRH